MRDPDLKWCLQIIPVKPSLIVDGQDSVWASTLKAANEGFKAVKCPSDELGAAECLQAAVVLSIVLQDQVVDAHSWVAVCHIEPTTCGTHHVKKKSHSKNTTEDLFRCLLDSSNANCPMINDLRELLFLPSYIKCFNIKLYQY